MTSFFRAYIVFWSAACFLAVILYLLNPRLHVISQRAYWNFLLMPWKIATFLISMAGMIVIAPYTGDFTWDYWDASFMSIFTFLTAPWVVGVMHRVFQKQTSFIQAYVALCVGMFSVSWSYDLYLLIRDGHYPPTWLANFALSSILYILAGLLWSLEGQSEQGVIFAFQEPEWPRSLPGRQAFQKALWVGLLLMVLAMALITGVIWNLKHPY